MSSNRAEFSRVISLFSACYGHCLKLQYISAFKVFQNLVTKKNHSTHSVACPCIEIGVLL